MKGKAPEIAKRMEDEMHSRFSSEETWPVRKGVPATGVWLGCGPSILHKDKKTTSFFITIPLALGMAGGTVLTFPEILQGFYTQPGDMCAFDGENLLHGCAMPSLTERAIRVCVSMWIDKRIQDKPQSLEPRAFNQATHSHSGHNGS